MGLDLVEVIMEVEDRFHVHLPDLDLHGVHTVNDLSALVRKHLGPDSLHSEAFVLETVRRITAEELGLALKDVRAESDFVRDLGAG